MPPPDLLLLICDTARADAFAPWNLRAVTPSIERLCREGVRFDAAVAAAPWTLPSTASMLTGQLPTEHGISGEAIRWVERRPSTPAPAVRAHAGPWLTEDLRARGYRTFAVSCNPWVSTWGGFDRGMDEMVDIRPWRRVVHGGGRWAARRLADVLGGRDHGGREAVEAAGRHMAAGGDRPWFGLVNLMEVHESYDPPLSLHPAVRWGRAGLPPLARLASPYLQLRQRGRVRDRASPAFLSVLRALYDACASYEDRLVGRIVSMVQERDRPAVVLLVSDHGENLGRRGLFSHHSTLSEDLVHVPMAMWGHRVDVGTGVDRVPRSLVGVPGLLRNLADTAGPVLPDGPVLSEYESTVRHMGGVPVQLQRLAARTGGAKLPSLVHHAALAVRDGDLKYQVEEDGRESLFDLRADPGEDRDLSSSRPEDVARFGGHADAWAARRSARTPPASGEEDGRDASRGTLAEDEMAEHLRMLGYIE